MNRERRWAIIASIFVAIVTCIPYLFGLMVKGARPALGWFSGYTFNATDHCVYLSWMQQSAGGAFFQRNLFTTDPQSGHQFNLFYLVLGKIAGLFGLSPLTVYHLSRPVLAVGLLLSIWWLIRLVLPEGGVRKTALLTVALSAGLGWIPGWWELPILGGPADTWQPEAITFLSMYLFPLFLVSQILMVGVIGFLWKADQTGQRKFAVYAGLCGLLLGNIHTYDVLTLSIVWVAYMVYRTIRRDGAVGRLWIDGLLAGAIAAPSTAYVAWMLKSEAVFRARAEVLTLTPNVRFYVLGFGLLLPLATFGWKKLRMNKTERPEAGEAESPKTSPAALLAIWTIFNFIAAYAPTTFQRKMMMGIHIPMSILAGAALWMIAVRVPKLGKKLVIAGGLILLSLTNVRFMARDIDNLPNNPPGVRSFLYKGEIAALEWIKEKTPAGSPVQPLPWISASEQGGAGFFDTSIACYTPGLTGHPVNAGHWGETPNFGKTMNQWVRFIQPETDEAYRVELLKRTGIKYVIFTQKHQETPTPDLESRVVALFRTGAPACLRRIPEACNDDADVYEVVI